MFSGNLSLKDVLISFKDDILKSRKYWIICLILILISFFAIMNMENYLHPKMEVAILILSCILCIFSIAFYQGHRDDKNFYKTVFVIIFIFGIVFSVLTPILCTHDEAEHFVRAEMTSNGIIVPEFIEDSVMSDGKSIKGHYITIQSLHDLSQKGTTDNNYGFMDMVNSSIFNTDGDTQPINTTPVQFHSAFAQNPFFGYIAPAIGMAIAKLLDLNAIWLLWLGRIFNITLYAALVAYAIKKAPILKIPLFVVACIPAALSQAASVSIDPIINGLAILSIAYFLNLYKSPTNSIDYKSIIKFFIIILLLTLCKVTYFVFIFLLLFIPRDRFKEKKDYYYIGLTIILLLGILAIWSTFFVNPGVQHSARIAYFVREQVNTTNQINYILNHKKDAIISIFHLFGSFDKNLQCESYFDTKFSSLYLMFTGAVYLLYPHEKINTKTKIGTLLVFCMLYFGTYILFMLTWNPLGDLTQHGVQPRYFFPAFALIPIFLGFNHMKGDTTEIDSYILMLAIAFIVLRILTMTILVY